MKPLMPDLTLKLHNGNIMYLKNILMTSEQKTTKKL